MYAPKLRPVAHIGPPKTATTSLQDGIIPRLGRPFQVKPHWCKALSRSPRFEPPAGLPPDVIVSEESLGDFAAFPPEVIAERLGRVFDDALVVFVAREPLDLFYSLYRQKTINSVDANAKLQAAPGRVFIPLTANQFFDRELERFRQGGTGYFAVARSASVRAAFEKKFAVEILPFDLVRSSPQAFVHAFSNLCGSAGDFELPAANRTARSLMEEALDRYPDMPPVLRARLLDYYTSSVLTSDREHFIRTWPQARTIDSFVKAFRFRDG